MKGKLTAGYSWKVILKPRDRGIGSIALIFPVADLNVKDEESMRHVASVLARNGFSGSLFKSGESGHFMADFLVPNSQGPQVAGRLIEILTPESNVLTHNHAQRYRRSPSFGVARSVAKDILEFPPESNADSSADLRYFGHIYEHNHGLASLRFLDAKGYGFSPYEICRIQ